MEANGTNNPSTSTNVDRKIVYTVVDTKNGKAVWVKIGAAFTNRDGSLTIRLDALPLNGTMQVREQTAWEDRRPDLASAGGGAPRHASESFA
jgi:hypothetical protein